MTTRSGIALARITNAAMAVATAAPSIPAHATDAHRVAAGAAAPDATGPQFANQSVRQVVRAGIAGSRVRIRLSNLFGATPVTISPLRRVGPARTRAGFALPSRPARQPNDLPKIAWLRMMSLRRHRPQAFGGEESAYLVRHGE